MPKDRIINFKIEANVKHEFEDICKESHTSASHELRLFVHQFIKRNKGRQILLSDLKKSK